MDIWIFNIFRSFLSLLDKMVYWFVELLISLFDSLASIHLFDSNGATNAATDFGKNLSDRVYIFLAIIMIFKVSFSIIQYIIDPDKFSNQEVGMGKVIRGILLVLVSLVGVRYVFSIAYDLQKRIMDNHIVEQIILGVDDKLTSENQITIKRKIPFSILSAFVLPDSTNNVFISFENGKYSCDKNLYASDDNIPQYDDNNVYNVEFGICLGYYSKTEHKAYTIKNENGEVSEVPGDTGLIYNYAFQNNDYSMLLDLVNDATASGKGATADVYIFDYKFIISTVAGVFVVIMYLNFCIDLAIRSVKFGFLQLIAPIPIISMIDPKSSKNGMMSKWVKNCINTYLGLFIRVAAVNFVVYVINIITDPTFFENSGVERNQFIQIVIILGALMFAKELPKLISDLTGIDMKGDFKVNPLLRLPGGKLATRAITGTAKAVGSLAGGAIGAAGQLGFTGASVLASSIGSFGQAAFGAARGQGWNFNSDRVAREWRLGRNRMGDAAIGGVNGALTNMGSIVGAKPKGIPTGADRKKSANREYREYEREINLGERLYNRENAGQSIYAHEDFAKRVADVKQSKQDYLSSKAVLENLIADKNAGKNVDEAQLENARKNFANAETVYNNRKSELEKMGATTRYADDFRRYNAVKAYKDLRDPEGNNNQPSSSNSQVNESTVETTSSSHNISQNDSSSSTSNSPSNNSSSSSSGSSQHRSFTPYSEMTPEERARSRERARVRDSWSNEHRVAETPSEGTMPTINPRQNNNNNSGGQP